MARILWTRKKGWINIDITDEMTLPAGCFYERRVSPSGQIQVRNGYLMGFGSPEYYMETDR